MSLIEYLQTSIKIFAITAYLYGEMFYMSINWIISQEVADEWSISNRYVQA